MTILTLVHGGNRLARESAIAAALKRGRDNAAIVEGLVGSDSPLDALAAANEVRLFRVSPACPCCSGNLTMRVTLNRVLRRPPDYLYLSLADTAHKASVLNFLKEDQYRSLLELGDEVDCG